MLHFESVIPENAVDGVPVVVLLHGRGSDERDLMEIGGALVSGAVVVTPRAPHAGAPWGYGPGWAWYRYMGRNRPEPESFDASLAALDELLRGLAEVLPVKPGPVVLGGFSQGGTMSVAYALQHPEQIALTLNLSGFLADHPSVEAGLGKRPAEKVFWGHGTGDPSIPFALAVEGRAKLAAAGVQLEERDYPIGHWIAPEELEDVSDWVRRGLGASHDGGRAD
ncbi:alpha/beta fold hydrolase [soil metagenome]